ncbi:MAG: hypothetical protein LW768_20505 [Rubrivivax sp.]|jgi:hypothetical protein|nr:hypothetical protein [Rubrivivax sp.]
MSEDPRCCGSGTCIIDRDGRCWCGQQWDGQKMCHAPLAPQASPASMTTGQPPARANAATESRTPEPDRS